MTERAAVTPRLFMGLVVLTLGVLWTLDNLGAIDASRVVRWWPALALGWGLMCLTGIGCARNTVPGLIWTLVGGAYLLGTLGLIQVSLSELWPLFLIVLGIAIVVRGWRGSAGSGGATEGGATLNTFSFMAGAERKVVAQDFRGGEVSAVMGGASVDFRPARLAEGRAVVDVFAMWGGIELIVPVGWRVVGEVTPVLGGFEDSTASPVDPSAPTLVVKGTVMMGGVEVKNEGGRRARVVLTDTGVEVGGGARPDARAEPSAFWGVALGDVRVRKDTGSVRKEVHVGPGGITITRGPRPEATPGASPAPGAAPAPGAPAPGPVDPE